MLASVETIFRDYLAAVLADPAVVRARQALVPLELSFGPIRAPGGLLDLAEALAESRCTAVVAPPGLGKTTLLSAILHDYAGYALNCHGGDLAPFTLCEETRLPVYADLASFSPGLGLEALLRQSVARYASPRDLSLTDIPIILLLDHLDRPISRFELEEVASLVQSLAAPSLPWRLVAALREEDLPLVKDWLPPLATVRIEPLSEERAYGYVAGRWGEEVARDMDDLMLRHGLDELGRRPLLLDFLVQLIQEERALLQRRRPHILKELARQMLGDVADGLQGPLATMAYLVKWGQGYLEKDSCLAILRRAILPLAAPESLERLISLGLLRWSAARRHLAFGHPLWEDLFAALHLAEQQKLGKDIVGLLPPDAASWGRTLSFLYAIGDGRSLLRALLPLNPELAVAACAANEPDGAAFKALVAAGLSPQLYLELGRAFRRLGRWHDVRRHLEEASRLHPERADMLYELAQANAASGQWGVALEAFQRLGKLSPPETAWPLEEAQALAALGRGNDAKAKLEQLAGRFALGQAEAYRQLSTILAKEGHVDEALRWAQQAIELSPSSPFLCHLGRLLHRLGRRQEARSLLERAVLADLKSPEAHAALAVLLQEEGLFSGAIAHYRQAVDLLPTEPSLHLGLGRALRLAGQVTSASLSLERAVRLDPDNAAARAELALVRQIQGRSPEALGQAEAYRAVSIAPQQPSYRYLLGRILRSLGRFAEAEAQLRLALADTPDLPEGAEAHDCLGTVLASQGRFAEAAACHREACHLSPWEPRYWRNLGVALAQAGDTDAALSELSVALDLCPQEGPLSLEGSFIAADIYSQRGRLLEMTGHLQEALADYRQATALLPHHMELRLHEAAAYGRLGEPQLALETLERAVASQPTDALARFRLGQAYEAVGQRAEALEQYRAAALEPEDAAPLMLAQGRLLLDEGRFAEAVAALEQAVHLDGTNAEALRLLGQAHEGHDNLEAALLAYRGAARLRPGDASLWVASGRAYRRLGRLAEGRRVLHTALSLDPSWAEAHAELARLLADQGQDEEALAAALRALEYGRQLADRRLREPHYLFLAGSLCHRLGRYEEALPYLRRAVALSPERGRWHHELGNVLERLGYEEEALAAYGEAVGLEPEDAEHRLALARLLRRRGDLDGATSTLEAALPFAPGAEVRRELTDILLLQDRPDSALEHARILLQGEESADHLALMARVQGSRKRWGAAARLWDRARALEPSNFQWHQHLAEAYEMLGRFAEAEAAHRRALELGAPAELRWDLARLCRRQGRREDAVVALQELLAIPGGPPRPEVWRELGDLCLALERWPEALKALDEALRAGAEESAQLFLQRGIALTELGRPQEAIAELELSLRLGGDRAEISRWLARAWREAANAEAALHYARQALELSPRDAQAQREMGLALLEAKRPGPAMGHMEAAVAANPRDALAWDGLGQAYEACGQVEEASAAFAQARQIAPEKVQYLCHWGRAQQRRGRLHEALPDLETGTRLHSQEAEVHFLCSLALAAVGRSHEALESCCRALALAPKVAEYHHGAGQLSAKLGLRDEAIEHLRQAVGLDSTHAGWHQELAESCEALGRWAEAGEAYQAAFALDKGNSRACYGAGICLHHQGKDAAALSWLERAVALTPQEASWHAALAEVRLALGDAEGALSALTLALKLEPEAEEHRIGYARALRLLGRTAAAQSQLLTLLDQNPDNALAHHELGLLRRAENRLPEAVAGLRRAVELAPERWELRPPLAEALNLVGRRREALENMAPLLAAEGVAASALIAAAHTFELLGDWEKAVLCYDRAYQRGGRTDYRLDAARLLARLGRTLEAKRALMEVLSTEGDDPHILADLGELLEDEGDTEKALAAFHRAVELEPTEPWHRYRLGRLLATLERYEAAEAQLREALRLQADFQEAHQQLGAVSAQITLKEAKSRLSQAERAV